MSGWELFAAASYGWHQNDTARMVDELSSSLFEDYPTVTRQKLYDDLGNYFDFTLHHNAEC